MADLRGFATSIRLRGAAIERNARDVMRRTALVVDSSIVLATPVDTGRARANWRVGVGARPTEILPEPASPGAGEAEAMAQAQEAVANYRDGEIHIANNLPYIGALNDGHSSQAPAAFVETAAARGLRAVQSVQNLTGELQMDEVEVGSHAGAGTVSRRKARNAAKQRLSVLDEEERGGH